MSRLVLVIVIITRAIWQLDAMNSTDPTDINLCNLSARDKWAFRSDMRVPILAFETNVYSEAFKDLFRPKLMFRIYSGNMRIQGLNSKT